MNSLGFNIYLSRIAHWQAEKFRNYQSDLRKGKQVYLNTLSIYAVNSYLNSLGFQTELEKSFSWNPIHQTLMNTADLLVKDCGKLECRPILPNSTSVYIPEEVWSQRIGYIAVQLDSSLERANLLGFVPQVSCNNLPLDQLRSLTEFPDYLSSLQGVNKQANREIVRLSQWLEEVFEIGWHKVEELYPSQLALNFRNLSQLANPENQDIPKEISRVKLLEVGRDLPLKQIGLMVKILPKTEQEIDISVSVKVYPADRYGFLPQGLQVMVLDEREVAVMQAEANNTETVEFKFSGEPGEYFCVKLVWEGTYSTEAFLI
jgi:Protein of unknown function (DUF1822)